MTVEVTSAPAAEPITSAEAKAYLRVEHAADDTLIGSLITAARVAVEAHTGRALINRTYRVTLDAAEARPPVTLPYGPVSSVTTVETWLSGAYAAASASAYVLAQDTLHVNEDGTADWPEHDRGAAAFRATYVAGYGATSASVPEPLRLAVRMLVLDYYEERLNPGALSGGVRDLLAPYVNYKHG